MDIGRHRDAVDADQFVEGGQRGGQLRHADRASPFQTGWNGCLPRPSEA
jgi:hypothetical protein